MEKYGAEVERYEVVKVIPHQPDDKEVVAEGLTLSESEEYAKKDDRYMVRPMK